MYIIYYSLKVKNVKVKMITMLYLIFIKKNLLHIRKFIVEPFLLSKNQENLDAPKLYMTSVYLYQNAYMP